MANPEVLDVAVVDERLKEGLDWGREGDELVKVHTEKDFASALGFVNRVGELAEAMNHHPDIDIRWNKVTLRLSTHSAGGITANDLDLAAQIDGLSESSD
jgi:4a-hydroxytetrahydrobiopterin dehydratase